MDAKLNLPLPLIKIKTGLEQSDILTGIGVVGILLLMIFPLPTILLDILLSLSFTISLVILLTSLYLKNPLEFSTYPALLLMTTLFRLSLNIASTRLILLHGNEGPGAAGCELNGASRLGAAHRKQDTGPGHGGEGTSGRRCGER